MTTDHDHARISQALHELVPQPPRRPDLFDQVADRARRSTRRRITVAALALATIAVGGGYLLAPGNAGVVQVSPASPGAPVVGCTPWPPPTKQPINLTPPEKDPVTGKVTYPVILAPPVDPGVAAICEQLVPLVNQEPRLVTDPRALATTIYSAVHNARQNAYDRTGSGHLKVTTAIIAGETIRKDSSGRWTTQLPGHACAGRNERTGNGVAVYHGRGADIQMKAHVAGCTAWAEVTRIPQH